MTKFSINDWRKKRVLKEGVGGVVSRNPFGKMEGMWCTEAVDHIDDKEAATDYDELGDKDLDNDGDTDASDKYLHKRQGKVAKVTEADDLPMDKMDSAEMEPFREEELSDEEFNIQEWQKRFLDKRNLKWG